MTAYLVDPVALASVADGIGLVARRAEPIPIEVSRSGLAGFADLTDLAHRMADVVQRVGALARVVALVADGFARTEARVGGAMAGGAMADGAVTGRFGPVVTAADWPGVRRLLESLDPAGLEALLVGAPALARLVVDRTAAEVPGSAASRLTALLGSGEPLTVRLRAAQALLAGLPDDVRRRLALLHPALVSGLASAPVRERVLATRVLVAAEVARLQERVGGLTGGRRDRAERRLRWYAELLGGVVTLTRPSGQQLVRPHQVIAFDPRGDGRVMEVFGDLATTRHLAVYVPGTGTSLDRYAGNAERASAFAAAEPDLAVVLWQNADFPDLPLDQVVPPIALWDRPVRAIEDQLRGHVFAAAYRDSADVAGGLLARDVEGLRMAEPAAGADLTVLGHSYGGSIVGSAEAHGLVADRVVHIASAGAFVSSVEDYAAGECGTRRFSMTAPDDPIQLAQGAGFGSLDQAGRSLRTVSDMLPGPLKLLTGPVTGVLVATSSSPLQAGHGLDPDLVPSVTRLDTGVRPDGVSLVSGHGGMFEPGSTAWRNLLAVMHGDPVSVLEPGRWTSEVVPAKVAGGAAGAGLVPERFEPPHYVVTRSPYAVPGYQSPVQDSTGRVCLDHGSW